MQADGLSSNSSVSADIQHRTSHRWAILTMLILFSILTSADRANIGVCLPWIKKEFALTNLQAGSIVSFFFLGYAVFQVPAGLVISKWGARVVTSVSTVLFSFFTFLIGASPTPAVMKLARLGLGVFEGPAGVAAGANLKPWFPKHEQGLATGLYVSANQIAFIIVPPICVAIATHFGWRMVFYAFAVPGALFGLLWALVVRNRPQLSRFCNQGEREYISASGPEVASRKDPVAASMGWLDTVIRVRRGTKAINDKAGVFKSWSIWANCLVFFFFGLCFWGTLTWIPSYLVSEKGYSFIRMGWLAMTPFLGGLVGTIGGGWMSDHVFGSRRKPVMIMGAIAAAIMMYVLANAPASVHVLGVILFLCGVAVNSPFPQYIAYSMGLTTQKTYPISLAMVATSGTLGGLVSPLIVGYMLDALKSYTYVFYFFGVAMCLSLVMTMTMIEPLQTIEPDEEGH